MMERQDDLQVDRTQGPNVVETDSAESVKVYTGAATPNAAGQLPIIEIDHVHMVFNMASEQLNNLKEYFIKLVHHELFFHEFVALDDVNFNIYPGERYGFVGVNGSGKSTLLKVIAGVLEPTTGEVRTYGTIAPLIELGAGFDMELTARENVYLNGALLGYSKAFIDEMFDSIIDFAEVQDFVDMPLKNYSSGMRARLGFAMQLADLAAIGVAALACAESAKAVAVVTATVIVAYAAGTGRKKCLAHAVGIGRRNVCHQLAQHPLDGTQYAAVGQPQFLGQDAVHALLQVVQVGVGCIYS